MRLDTSYNNIREVLSILQKYKQKMIAHNNDNTNKLYNIYI
jgi:DNA polymerase sigma